MKSGPGGESGALGVGGYFFPPFFSDFTGPWLQDESFFLPPLPLFIFSLPPFIFFLHWRFPGAGCLSSKDRPSSP